MPTIYGHKLRWTEDQTDCTECGEPHDGRWFMVSVMPGEKLLCRTCLPVWKAEQKAAEAIREAATAEFTGGLCGYD